MKHEYAAIPLTFPRPVVIWSFPSNSCYPLKVEEESDDQAKTRKALLQTTLVSLEGITSFVSSVFTVSHIICGPHNVWAISRYIEPLIVFRTEM